MRQSQILSMLQSGYKTCTVSYRIARPSIELRTEKLYTFKHNLDLKEGDLVVAPATTSLFKVCQVVEAHEEPELDLDADFDYKWLVSKVDLTQYEEIIRGEKEALKVMRNLECETRRKEAREKLSELYGDEVPLLNYTIKGLCDAE